ncbi:YpuI family protein [Paenibacillus humicola]|uniref:YpuI family protein n=1 Tax=Paenibacillus humicola TaxID=3110540 RepID=UPI00237A3C70|nr:YpuI family protein [Paenibacillus humicola]
MPSTNVKPLSESTRDKLKSAIGDLEIFLNGHALPQLVGEDQGNEARLFYKGLLSDLRHLLVFSEVAYEKLGVVLRRPNFDQDFAERALYEVYHQCVNAFFYPKNECYSEDGRYAYTGQDAIRFRMKPVREVRDIVLSVSKIFEELRDDLSYYESDYMTQRRMQGQK